MFKKQVIRMFFNFYNKRNTLIQIRNAVKLANEMNIVARESFIFGAPIEIKKHFENTIKFACSLPLDVAIFYPLTYCPGSDLYDEAIKAGKTSKNKISIVADSRRGLGNF